MNIMKNRISTIICSLLVMCCHMVTAQPNPSDNGDYYRLQISSWLYHNNSKPKVRLFQWNKFTSYEKSAMIYGLLTGSSIADILVPPNSMGVRNQDAVYLLQGWNMSPSDYQLEIGAVLDTTSMKPKSVATSLVLAEANFAINAGQSGRGYALKVRSQNVLRCVKSAGKNSVLHVESDGIENWKKTERNGGQRSLITGILEGILLARAETETQARCMPVGFRVGQLIDAIDEQAKIISTWDRYLIEAFLLADHALRDKATSE